MPLNDQTRSLIEQTLKQNKIVLFMKGTKSMPRCGFSAQVVQILEGLGVEYRDVNVLSDPNLRDGIKEFGNWPTIPQLYVDGNLVGGCDIIRQLDEDGELGSALGLDARQAAAVPTIKLGTDAVAAIKDAAQEAGPGQHLRIELKSGGRAIDLYFDEPKGNDVRVETGGITLLLDRASARLANGLSIEFVPGPEGGFKIDNPNLPAKVKTLSPKELKEKLDQKVPLRLYDVRGQQERATASIAGSLPFDERARAELESLPKDTMLVFQCHHGMRSQAAAEAVLQLGFKNVWNLAGGIEAWSTQVDPRVPRY